MKVHTIVGNALFAALYIAVTGLIAPFGFTNIQFRLSEIFNHLIVFNTKYFFGILLGVIISNFLFSPMVALDLIFGVGQTALSLGLGIYLKRFIKGMYSRMFVLTCIFTFNMFLIAIMLNIVFGVPFLFGWATAAAGEFVVMIIGIPMMVKLNERLNFSDLIEGLSRKTS